MLGANQALGCWEISLSTSLGIFIISLIREDHNEVQRRFLKYLFLLLGILPQQTVGEFSAFTDFQSPPRSKVFLVCIVAQGGTWFSEFFPQIELEKC